MSWITRFFAWRARRKEMRETWLCMMKVTDADDIRRLHDKYRELRDTPF
jgi:hypothetical protein